MAFPQQQQQPQGAPMPQQQPPVPQQNLPQQGGEMMPQDGMAPEMPQLNGEEVQMLLFSRIQEMTPQEMMVLDSIITPETVPVLFKLLPELGILFEQASAIQAYMQQNGGGAPQPQAMEEGETRNPLVNDNLSEGLMG